MTPLQYWLIAAIVLFLLEIITPGFVLANFAVGALGGAAMAWMGFGVTAQIIGFVIVCLVSFVTVRPLINRFIYRNQARVATNVQAIIGTTGVVTDAIGVPPLGGRVQIGGDNWHALAVDGSEIAIGERVRVDAIESTTILVSQIPSGRP
jgi:membrane protein implicated in regulation of membrane protease activity